MSSGLTYPSLKCVFEYLEANRRIHITSRCPQFKRIANEIPIHLGYLHLTEFSIQVNNFSYTIEKVSEIVPGFEHTTWRVSDSRLAIQNCSRLVYVRHVWKGISRQNAARMMKNLFLKGRTDIFVDFLKLSTWKIENFGQAQLRVKKLEILEDFRFEMEQIHSSSYPLEEIRIGLPRLWLQDELLQLTKQATVVCDNSYWTFADVVRISHPNVLLKLFAFEYEIVLRLVGYWKSHDEKKWKQWRISGSHQFINDYLEAIRRQFNARTLQDNKCYSIAIDSTSELHISVISSASNPEAKSELKIEIAIPIPDEIIETHPETSNSASKRELKLEIAKPIPEKIEKTNLNKFEDSDFLLICTAVLLALLLFLMFYICS